MSLEWNNLGTADTGLLTFFEKLGESMTIETVGLSVRAIVRFTE